MHLKNKTSIIVLLFISLSILILHFGYRAGKPDNTILQEYKNRYTKNKNFQIPIINGKRESCLVCHGNMKGFSPSHDPHAIGCSSCHGGNPFSLNKDLAHKNMIKIPGNLQNTDQACQACHQDISSRIHDSLMATGRGMVAVNRYVFDEIDHPDGPGHLSDLGHGPADSHLRRLCASCHLNNPKTEFAPITQKSRGGGCTACHLHYSPEAAKQLEIYHQSIEAKKKIQLPTLHPSLTVKITNEHCFGCHSRSGRLATNFEGWHETQYSLDQVKGKKGFRQLEDGRIFEKKHADIHYERGMLCIDCHTSYETMGDGKKHVHQEYQTQVRCTDCHTDQPTWLERKNLTSEEKKLVDLHQIPHPEKNLNRQKFLRIQKSGRALINAFPSKKPGKGKILMIGKTTGKIWYPKPFTQKCAQDIDGHKKLSCQSCHTNWAPHCIVCHTQWDKDKQGYDHLYKKVVPGAWVEHFGPFLAEPPTLGVRKIKEGKGKPHEIIDTFIPGMVLTINPDAPNPDKILEKYKVFRRMYSPISAHTTMLQSRSCKSCHNDPVAIGYGRGNLSFEKSSDSIPLNGQWRFEQMYEDHKADGLPLDAWIGFLQTRTKDVATRSNARPFHKQEQIKILTVGSCLTCHPDNARNMQRIYNRFEWAQKNLSPKCIAPRFD